MQWVWPLPRCEYYKGILRTSLDTDDKDYNKEVPWPLICWLILPTLRGSELRTIRLVLMWRDSRLALTPSINSARLDSDMSVVWWGKVLTCVDRTLFLCHVLVFGFEQCRLESHTWSWLVKILGLIPHGFYTISDHVRDTEKYTHDMVPQWWSLNVFNLVRI